MPASILGDAALCASQAVTLSADASGGTWSSGNSSIATVGSLSGIVSGVAIGTAVVTYTSGYNCRITRVVTVNGISAITGTPKACVAGTTTLSNTTTGGEWSSGNISVASIGSTGVVFGVSAGTVLITYNPPTGCFRTISVTVNPVPANISGISSLCVGAAGAVTDSTAGGVSWLSSNTSVATVGVTSGVVSGIASGTTTITYNISNGCYTTKTITVNSNPSSITGSLSVCAGVTGSLSSISSGGTWSSSNYGVATVGSATGLVTGVVSGTATISYALSTGCYTTKVATVNICAKPADFDHVNTTRLFSFFPNPTSGLLKVNSLSAGVINIYGLEGKLICSLPVSEGETELSIPQTVAPGIYLVKYIGDNGTEDLEKLIYAP